MASHLRTALAIVLLCAATDAVAWNEPKDTVGPLSVTIKTPQSPIQIGSRVLVAVSLANGSDEEIRGTLRLGVIDDWRVEGPDTKPFSVAPRAETRIGFHVVAGERSYAAHYPIHAYADFELGGEELQAHPIAIVIASRPRDRSVKDTPRSPSLSALRALTPVAVDGVLDEWDNALSVPLGQEHLTAGSAAPGDFSAIFRALHDGSTLYLGLRVADDRVTCTDITSRDFVDSDHVRLYLSGIDPAERHDTTLTPRDLVLAINPFGAAAGPLMKTVNYHLPARRDFRVEQVKCASRRMSNGFDLEVAIPLVTLGGDLKTGSTMGFNMMLGDTDDGRREAELSVGRRMGEYWTNPMNYVPLLLADTTHDDGQVSLPATEIRGRGATALDRLSRFSVQIDPPSKGIIRRPLGWFGQDQRTGASYQITTVDRGGRKRCIGVHPLYRTGAGVHWAYYRLGLPDVTPITFTFANAIRDHTAKEPPSDGIEFRVMVQDGPRQRELFRHFTAAKRWEPAEVNLSEYAGKTVLLRLWCGPGPKNNTVCDSGYWAEPTVVVGKRREPEPERATLDRRTSALRLALTRDRDFTWQLSSRAGQTGACIVPGPNGLIDAALAFRSETGSVAFSGFHVAVDGSVIDDWRSPVSIESVESEFQNGRAVFVHHLRSELGRFSAKGAIWADRGSLVVSFKIDGIERNLRGEPRFTAIRIGSASAKARRVFAGFGNVVEEPSRFSITRGGFRLSTRHVGVDYETGLSIVQATNVFPDRFDCLPEEKLYALVTPHDATFRFIPSEHGAFAAARVYRDLSGFQPGKGVAKLLGKMCIDQWGGDYLEAAKNLERAGEYGLTDAVFVKHSWQRWGYDYRLPDIYPPRRGLEPFKAMVEACRKYGILFAPHDNYIDFYPDADDFSFKHIIFNRDGTPQRAWFNKGRKSQSYRWLPHAFMPWLERNMKLMRDGFAPTGLFIDVFSAMPPIDYYDHSGRFYTRQRTAREWSAAFDRSREILGGDVPMLSEAGHDALVGHLDGCQSDHYAADRWGAKGSKACRTPWHDMATHRSLVLLAGGLGHRYSNRQPGHGYGTDDYLCNTVMGGRNPMCDGPCYRRTVMTYWLLHDVCAILARHPFESHEFFEDDVYRQITRFGESCVVRANRGSKPWHVGDSLLPQYGFITDAGSCHASITVRDGYPTGFAQSPGITFVDARPRAKEGKVASRVIGAKYLGGGKFDVAIEWEVFEPLPDYYVPFVHVTHPEATHQGERIAIHASMSIDRKLFGQPGVHRARSLIHIPSTSYGGEYGFRYGLYARGHGGSRLTIMGQVANGRVLGGSLFVRIEEGKVVSGEYHPQPTLPTKRNTDGKLIDFGTITTNGAFRLLHHGKRWTLLPLPGSIPFAAQLRLDGLGPSGANVTKVTALSQARESLREERFTQADGVVTLNLNGNAFRYEIELK